MAHRRAPLLLVALLSVPACTGSGLPATPRFTVTIGAGGGSLVVGTGEIELAVPPGALTSDVAVSLARGTAAAVPGWTVAGTAYAFEPGSTRFAVPARMVIPFRPYRVSAAVDPSELRIAHRDTAGVIAAILPTLVDGNRVTFDALGLGTFWVIAPDVVSAAALFPANQGDSYRFASGLELGVARTNAEPNLRSIEIARLDFQAPGRRFGLYLDDRAERLATLGEFDVDELQEVLAVPLPWLEPREAMGTIHRAVGAFTAYAPYGSSTRAHDGVLESVVEIVEREDLVTPAGEFAVVHVVIASVVATTATPRQERRLELWLAEGVGPVAVRIGDSGERDLLVAGTVGGLPVAGR